MLNIENIKVLNDFKYTSMIFADVYSVDLNLN